MKIKKYQAINIKEAVKQIKGELGNNAVILSTKSIVNGKGIFGIFNRPLIEVTAATDTEYVNKIVKPSHRRRSIARNKENPYLAPSATESHIQNEITELKRMVETIYRDMNQNKMVINNRLYPYPNKREKQFSDMGFHANITKLYNDMIYNGIQEHFAFQFLSDLAQNIPPVEFEDFETMRDIVSTRLKDMVKVEGTVKAKKSGAKATAFIGPTGSGKTTTIAKLAAYFTLKEKLNVGLITIDTYRIAAVEQLKIYAQILKIPVKVALSKDQLKSAISSFKDKDLIFIDTAGRSFKNKKEMSELASFFELEPHVDKQLVVSCTTDINTNSETIHEFNRMSPGSIIFSKIDEGISFGNILNSSLSFNLPISYLTTGQSVPEDIELATAGRVVELVMGKN